MTHWIKKIGFAASVGLTAGFAVFGGFAFFEWAVGFPAEPRHIAFGIGATAAAVGWNA